MNINNEVIRNLRDLVDADMTEAEFLQSVESNMIPMQ